MKHIIALILKFVMIAVILEIALYYMTALTFGQILVVSLAVTAVLYFIGDLFLLSKTNNITTSVVDVVLALAVIYLFRYANGYTGIDFTDALWSSLIIGAGELLFHKYVSKMVFTDHIKERNRS